MMFPRLCALAGLISGASALNIVFQTPDVIEAGHDFTIHVDLANVSNPDDDCAMGQPCNWNFFRTYILGPSTYASPPSSSGNATITRRFCYLDGCVAANVTSYESLIPAAAFPNGGTFSLDHDFFNDSGVLFNPTFAAFASTRFNISDSTSNLTIAELSMMNFGTGGILELLPCSAMPCAQTCQQTWVTAEGKINDDKLNACLTQCMGSSDPMASCVVRNATAAEESASGTVLPTGTGTGSEGSATATGTATGTAASSTASKKSGGSRLSMKPGSFVALLALPFLV